MKTRSQTRKSANPHTLNNLTNSPKMGITKRMKYSKIKNTVVKSEYSEEEIIKVLDSSIGENIPKDVPKASSNEKRPESPLKTIVVKTEDLKKAVDSSDKEKTSSYTPSQGSKAKEQMESSNISNEENKEPFESNEPYAKSTKYIAGCIGTTEFIELRENYDFFVDKSNLISDLMGNHDKVVAILYPRRFGKSSNLDMLKTFFELELDKNGRILELKEKKNPKYFLGGEIRINNWIKKLEPLKISQNQEIIDNYLGKHPIIYIDFKGLNGEDGFKTFRNLFKSRVYDLYNSHYYLIDSPNLTLGERNKCRKYIENPAFESGSLIIALRDLSIFLRKHWDKKVFVLIDEYDSPIAYAFRYEGTLITSKMVLKIIAFLSNVFSHLLKTNDKNVEKAVVTGILHIEQAGFLSELKNVITCSSYYPDFTKDYYGFDHNEVEHLIFANGVNKSYLIEMKNWYNGYIFGSRPIYNPWSILNCISALLKKQDGAFRNHWCATGHFDILINMLKFSNITHTIKKLLSKSPLQLKPIPITKTEFQSLLKICNDQDFKYQICPQLVSDLYFISLFHLGYLTKDNNDQIKIPNKEIQMEFEKQLKIFFGRCFEKIDFKSLANILVKILDPSNYDLLKMEKILLEFCTEFNKMLQNIPNFVNMKDDSSTFGVNPNEDIIHSLLNVAILHFEEEILFGSEIYGPKQSRCDEILMRKITSTGAIIEVKFEKDAQTGLDQIIDKNYNMIFSNDIRHRLYVGFNVSREKKSTMAFHLETIN